MEERPGAQRLNRKLMVFPDRCREQVYHHLSHFEIGVGGGIIDRNRERGLLPVGRDGEV